MSHAFSLLSRTALAFALLLATLQAAPAQTGPWNERRYDPPAGSKWSVVSQADSNETRPQGVRRVQHIGSVAEFTIEEKLADGFRVSYVKRDISITGDAPGTELSNAAFAALKNIVVRGRLDATGKPVAIDNLEEVRSTMRAVIARIKEGFRSNPKVAELVGKMLEGLFMVDGREAAAGFMEELVTLSYGQNTGLRPGEVRRANSEVPSPLGGGVIKAVEARRLAAWDEAAGTAQVVRRQDLDPESMRKVVLDLARQIASAADDKMTPEVMELMKNIKFSIDGETILTVKDGMTHTVDDRSATEASVMGQSMRKLEIKTVKVTRLP